MTQVDVVLEQLAVAKQQLEHGTSDGDKDWVECWLDGRVCTRRCRAYIAWPSGETECAVLKALGVNR